MKNYIYKKKHYSKLIGFIDTIGYFIKETFFRKLKPITADDVRHIAIFKLDHAGDILLATPAMKAIRKGFPQAHITLVVGPWGKGIVDGETFFDEIVCYSAYWHNRNVNRSFNIKETLHLIKTLNKTNYDIFFDLRGDLFAIIIAFLCNIPRRIGFGWMGGGFLLTDEIMTSTKKHQVEIILDAVRAAGIEPKAPQLSIAFSTNDSEYALHLLEKEAWDSSVPVVGFHIGSGYPSKMWPTENYSEVMEKIKNSFGLQIVIVGGPDDAEISKQLESSLSFKPINLTGKTTFKQTAAIIKKCSLFIGNDSVPVHIAAATGTPTIVIFSAANNYQRWRPFGSNVSVITKDVPCKMCELQNCDHLRCLRMITADEVLDNIKALLDKK